MILNFLKMLLYFICATGFWVTITKKSFGKCLPITFMISAFSYFISQVLFDTFKVGFIVNIFMALAFILMIIYKLIKRKDLQEIKNNFFSKGFYAFLVVFVCVFIFDYNRAFSVWDEFSHWGQMVKEMLRLDRFYSIPESTLSVHKDYPPIMQILEMFFCNINGGYKESYVLMGIHLFSFSLFIPAICENSSKFSKVKIIINSFLMLLCMYLVILLFDQHGIINSCYLDYIMPIITAYLLSQVLFEEKPLSWSSLLTFSLGSSFLVLAKQMGLVFYLMVLFMFGINLFVRKIIDIKKIFTKESFKSLMKVLIFLIIIPFMFWFGWNSYVSRLEVKQQFKLTDLKITELNDIVKGVAGEDYQKNAATNYIQAIKVNNLSTSKLFTLTYLQCMIIIIALIYIIWIKFKGITFKKGEIILSVITLIIGAIGYSYVMLVLYVFSFGAAEGPSLASFNRYIPTYILIGLLFVLYLFIYVVTKKDEKSKYLKYFMCLFGVLLFIQNPELLHKLKPALDKPGVTLFEHHADIISSKTKEDDKIFIVSQGTAGGWQFYIKYYMNPRNTNYEYYNLPYDVDDFENYFYSEVNDYMLEYDYLYLANIEEEYKKDYSFLFGNEDIKIEQLFKIENNKGKVKLTLVS